MSKTPRHRPAYKLAEPLSDVAWVAMKLQEQMIVHSGPDALTSDTAERCVKTAQHLLEAARRVEEVPRAE